MVLKFLTMRVLLMQLAISAVGFWNSALATGPGAVSPTKSQPERDTASRGLPRDPSPPPGIASGSHVAAADHGTRAESPPMDHVLQARPGRLNTDHGSAEPGGPRPTRTLLQTPTDEASQGRSLSAAAAPAEEEKSEIETEEAKTSVPDSRHSTAEQGPGGNESDCRPSETTSTSPVPGTEKNNFRQAEARTLHPSAWTGPAALSSASSQQHRVGHNLRQSAYAHTSPADGVGGDGGKGGGKGGDRDSGSEPPVDRQGSSSSSAFVEIIAAAFIASVVLSWHTMEIFLICLGVLVSAVLVLSTCLFLHKNRTVRQVYEVPAKEEKSGGRPPPYDDLEHLPSAVELQRRAMPLPPPPPSDPKCLPDGPYDPLSPVYTDGGLQQHTPRDDATLTGNRTMTRVGNHLYHELEQVPAGRPEPQPPISDYLECLGPAPPPPIDLNRLSALPPPSASMLDLTGD